MRILILGGNAWLGRHIVSCALEAAHHVTCLVRGESGAPPFGATLARADRSHYGAYSEVCELSWDCVVDVSRQPGQVHDATTALADTCSSYIFVSSTNAYSDHELLGQDEAASTLPALDAEVMKDMSLYGQAKVACEQHVVNAFGASRSLVARVGLIGGPGDESDRTGYWPLRFATASKLGRDVLAPDTPRAPTQIIDVRDLAKWIVSCAETRASGTFNVTGETVPFEDLLSIAKHVASCPRPVVAASSEWLLDQQVSPWMGSRSLPLWIPMKSHAGFSARDSSKAMMAGLVRRPLGETLRDTLNWELSRTPFPYSRRAGLSDEDEANLLSALRDA